ncbi:MAG: glycine cleavage system aminomethyltransferase GcvT [Candidatus Hydrogenedentes bacterium]|nr:glycine cleavage system aminomethyltransferase GcvT [Candidatus Hydrogenedentota bacterium]
MRRTPLHDEHVALGGKVVDFHGWALPVQFAGIIEEHHHARAKASLFDCSHMGEFVVRGEAAVRAFGGLVCLDPLKVPVGRGKYGAMLNDAGGIIDDVIAFRLGEFDFYVVTNAGPLDVVSARILEASGPSDVSDATAKIDIQGPIAREVLVNEIPECVALKYYQARRAQWRGIDIVLARTGYTGELGYELFVPNDVAVDLWRALLAYPDVKPAGLGARDTLRTEMCYGLSGQDFDESRTPLEAGMAGFIAWDKEFVGRDALIAKRGAGGLPVLTPIKTADRRAPRHGFDVKHEGEIVGVVTSGTFGPSVGCGIGLAYVPESFAAPGVRLTAGPRDLEIETTTIPIFGKGTCRT